jgi:hypothetical protein
MWTYLLGPIVALFPRPWRESLPFSEKVEWKKATAISGSAEFVLAIYALGRWYMEAMSTWTGNGVSAALSGGTSTEVSPQAIGGVAWIIWAMHPVTWLIAFACLEGAIRLCTGAFSGTACGIFPLYLADKIMLGPFRRGKRGTADASGDFRENLSSYAGAIRERVQAATLAESPDEHHYLKDQTGEILEIRASRRKQDWIPPRIIRYLDAYYRLEDESSGPGNHPFRYRLRRLGAGVPGRNVLIYAPADPVIRETILR